MPHNFSLHKENGIYIRTFHGEDGNDRALLDLIPIFTEIASNRPDDIRLELALYNEEILRKVSSHLDRKK
jgi:hypothetical protein